MALPIRCWWRGVNRRDANQMPPIGSNRVDAAGVALLTQWILQMNPTTCD